MRSARSGWSLSCSTWRRRTGWPSPPRHDRRSLGNRVVLPVGLQPAAHRSPVAASPGWSATGQASGGDCPGCGRPAGVPGLVDSHVTSTSRGVPIGKDSPPPPGPQAPVAPRPSSTCRSTRSRPPSTGITSGQRRAAAGQCVVDVAFWGGLTPDSVDEIEALAGEGVCGFKAFLVDRVSPNSRRYPRMCLKRPYPSSAPSVSRCWSMPSSPGSSGTAHRVAHLDHVAPVGGGGWRGQDADRPGRGDGAWSTSSISPPATPSS